MRRIAVFLLFVVLLAFPQPARARPGLPDIAPPIFPPGAALEPGADTTAVEMRAETVLIAVKDGGTNSLGAARVTADFTMHNPSRQAETLAVRFPIAANDGRMQYPEISNIAISVDGRAVRYSRVDYPSAGRDEAAVPWAEFTVTFPAEADTAVRVSYDLQGSGYFPYTAFYYLLHTGAGWSGNIGRAEISLRLPYPASPQNVVLDTQIGWAETTPGGEFDGNEVRWVFENFEPGDDGPVRDLEFALVAPAAWKGLLNAQAEVKARPQDGEAWGRLGKRAKDLFLQSKGYRADPGGLELYDLSLEAYEECLRLKPGDAQWHAGFAALLANRAYWDSWAGDPVPESYRALEELHTALQLAPRDSLVLGIAEEISWMLPDGMQASDSGYDFPWLTQTPTPLPPTIEIVTGTPRPDILSTTPAPTWTPMGPMETVVVTREQVVPGEAATAISQAGSPAVNPPASTPTPILENLSEGNTPAPTPTPADDPDGGGGLCGSVLLVLLPLLLVVHRFFIPPR